MVMRTPALGRLLSKPAATPTGQHSRSRLAPSACRWVDRIPAWVSALSTTAPAPSPNNTQVVRSVQSTIRVRVSAPTTSTVFATPARMKLSATLNPNRKPEQAALTSNAAQPAMPSFCWIRQAVDGKM